MNILFTAYHPLGYGGAEIIMLHLARELIKKGHNVIIASTEPYPELQTLLFKKVKKQPYFLQEHYLKNFFIKILKQEKIDLIHSHDRITAVPAINAARKTGIKSVTHYRDYWFSCPKSTCLTKDLKICNGCETKCLFGCSLNVKRIPLDWYKMFHLKRIHSVLEQADAKIANSTSVKEKLEKNGIKTNIHIAHPFRSNFNIKLTKKEEQVLKTKYNLKKKIITYAGNLEPNKGIQLLIPVVKELQEEFDFLIIGDGSLNNYLRKQMPATFTGKLTHAETLNLFSISDAILLPSLWEEPFSGIILEAAALGKPLIATTRGGILDLPSDRYLGINNPFDKEEWKQQLLKLKQPKALLQLKKNMKKTLQEHQPEKIILHIEEIYTSLKNKSP